MLEIKEYTIETIEQIPLYSYTNKYFAILKCLFIKKAKYVFEFEVDENDDYELLGCVFNKERWC